MKIDFFILLIDICIFSMIKINKYRIEYLQYKYIVYEYLIDKKKLYLKMNYYL